jgi:GTP cyclohydrolase I
MNIQTLKNNRDDILNCKVKDPSGLHDYQKLPNEAPISIPKVGIERFRIPMDFMHPNNVVRSHDTSASMFIYLDADKTGANMSRFCAILQDISAENPVNDEFFAKVLDTYRLNLRDYDHEEPVAQSHLKLEFDYPVKQPSLKSDNWGWQYYRCTWEGKMNDDGLQLTLTVNYEYSSTCPCSLSMAKQYEDDYRNGRTTEGNGIATAHSQRSLATVSATYEAGSGFSIEDFVKTLRVAIPTETQSLVKRVDEQAFAILNGENPVFVEHVARRLSLALDGHKLVKDWSAKIEHFESLHSHNAVAYINKQK